MEEMSFILLFILLRLSASATAQDQTPYVCLRNGNYTANSTYASNLRSLLSSLPSNTTFFNASAGRGGDAVNAIALCRGDRTLEQCNSCVQTASQELLQLCPNQTQAIIWNEFCMLRYSNELIYLTPATDPEEGLRNNGQVSNLAEFVAARTGLFDAVRAQAAGGGTELKVGVGTADVKASQRLNVLMQCTPDLSAEECDDCLTKAGRDFRSCCDAAAGVRMLMPSCNLRYEVYPFYNETRLREVGITPVSVSSPPPVTSPPETSGNNTSPGKKDDNNNTKVIIIIVVFVAGVTLSFVACVVFFTRKRMKRNEIAPQANEEISTVESLQYDFDTIRDATNDFSDQNQLGQGGFGAVYKGKLPNGHELAVKRLSANSQQGDMEFKNEVVLLAKLQHRNLVRLLGFSVEQEEKLLVYEFVHKGSLDHYIFDKGKRSHLDWDKRLRIIWGIARGLVYLHEESRLKIIHRDLKPSNVLLDRELNPKIADFGLARLFGQDETQGNTSKIAGTYGYISPEYGRYGQFSVKSDVFSFGVLVLEIISGRRNNLFPSAEGAKHLLSFAWENWREGSPRNVIDPLLKYGSGSMSDILRCIQVGLLCVQANAGDRPTMTSVVLMLNSSATQAHPLEPAFYQATEASRSDDSSNIAQSNNDVSITELYPR